MEFAIKGRYREARPSVLEYLKSTAIVNPHAKIIFTNPDNKIFLFDRASPDLPKLPTQGVKPHPHGVELGQVMRMAHHSKEYQMGNFSKSRNATGRSDQEGKDGFHGWNKKGDDQ